MKHGELAGIFANYYSLYLKVHCYHWNITGDNFAEVHNFLGEQYEALIEDIDSLAERIRILGSKVPLSYSMLSSLSVISDPDENLSSAAMLEDLRASNQKLMGVIELVLSTYEQDLVTTDLLTQKLAARGKFDWFVSSFLGR